MYMQAHPTNDPRPCRDAPGFGTGTDRPGYFEIGLLHEILHVIGFSPACAPHASASAFPDHVNDSPTDLMYGPDATHTAGWNWANAVLDFNRDDYYRANVPGCADLSNSPYLAALHSVSVTVSGPGTVTSSPAGIDCPGSCTGMFQRAVTLTADAIRGRDVQGLDGSVQRDGHCVVTGEGSASASFSASVAPAHPHAARSRAACDRRAGVVDGFARCRARAP